MIVWIERPLAIAIHERQLAEHGGGTGVRDDHLLDSALARPRQLHAYVDPPSDLADLVASDEDKYVAMIALAEGSLAEAEFAAWLRQHIKLDGKKRVNEPRKRCAR